VGALRIAGPTSKIANKILHLQLILQETGETWGVTSGGAQRHAAQGCWPENNF
jgi:hypothetical protein